MANLTLFDFLELDATLLDAITLPTGMTLSTLKNIIEDRSGQLCTWIQDATRLKTDITSWSAHRVADWTRLYSALTDVYNPLHNYDREEVGSEDTARHKGTKRSRAYKDTDTPGAGVTNTGYVSAYDTNAEAETGKSTSIPDGNSNTRQGLEADNYDIEQDLSSSQYDHDTLTFDGRHTRGNIGVMTTQSLIREEVCLRMEMDLYELIAGEFENKFCMEVY